AFEMTLLRMLAFRPEQAEPGMASSVPTSSGSGERSRGPLMPPPTDVEVRRQGAGPVRPVAESVPGVKRSPAGGQERGAGRSAKLPMPTEDHEVIGEMPPNREWEELIRAADLRGAVRQLAEHCVLLSRVGNRWELLVADSGATLN